MLFAESLPTFQHLQSECEVTGTLSLMMGVRVGMWSLVLSSGKGLYDEEEGLDGKLVKQDQTQH